MHKTFPTPRRIRYPEKRRDFLRALFAALTVTWAGGMAWALRNFFFFRPKPAGFAIGSFQQYTPGRIVHNEQLRIFIVRDTKGLYVMSDTCTHRNCMLLIDAGYLRCPCHNARFDLYGNPVKGPAEKQLDYYYISKNREKALVVDPARTVPSSFRYIE